MLTRPWSRGRGERVVDERGGSRWDFTGGRAARPVRAELFTPERDRGEECHTPDGERMACTPDLLEAERDRFYWNLGDGRFEEVGERVGLRDVDGRGLG